MNGRRGSFFYRLQLTGSSASPAEKPVARISRSRLAPCRPIVRPSVRSKNVRTVSSRESHSVCRMRGRCTRSDLLKRTNRSPGRSACHCASRRRKMAGATSPPIPVPSRWSGRYPRDIPGNSSQPAIDQRRTESQPRQLTRIPAGQSRGTHKGIDPPAFGRRGTLDQHRPRRQLNWEFACARDHCRHRHRLVGQATTAGRQQCQALAESARPVAGAGGAGGNPKMEAVAIFRPRGMAPPAAPHSPGHAPHRQPRFIPGQPELEQIGHPGHGGEARQPAGLVKIPAGRRPERFPPPAGEAERKQSSRIDQRTHQQNPEIGAIRHRQAVRPGQTLPARSQPASPAGAGRLRLLDES